MRKVRKNSYTTSSNKIMSNCLNGTLKVIAGKIPLDLHIKRRVLEYEMKRGKAPLRN